MKTSSEIIFVTDSWYAVKLMLMLQHFLNQNVDKTMMEKSWTKRKKDFVSFSNYFSPLKNPVYPHDKNLSPAHYY